METYGSVSDIISYSYHVQKIHIEFELVTWYSILTMISKNYGYPHNF